MGRWICRALVREGYSLVMACLCIEEAIPFYNELVDLAASLPDGDRPLIWLRQLNLASFERIDAFTASLPEESGTLNRLVHNAGVLPKKTFLTGDGLEMITQVNCAGGLYLTQRLEDALERGARTEYGARIIFTVSCTVYFGLFGRLKPSFLTRVPHTWAGRVIRYGDSKRAVYFASLLLAQHLKAKGVQVVSADPGAVDTPMISMNNALDAVVNRVFRPLLSSAEEGASTAVYLATAPVLPQSFGGTYRKRMPRQFRVRKDFKVVREYLEQLQNTNPQAPR